jgi:hypothetical protein
MIQWICRGKVKGDLGKRMADRCAFAEATKKKIGTWQETRAPSCSRKGGATTSAALIPDAKRAQKDHRIRACRVFPTLPFL